MSDDLPEIILDNDTISIEDLSGNNDGNLNPSEIANLNIEIKNNSDTDVQFLMADCTTNSPYITLSNNCTIGGMCDCSYHVWDCNNEYDGEYTTFKNLSIKSLESAYITENGEIDELGNGMIDTFNNWDFRV